MVSSSAGRRGRGRPSRAQASELSEALIDAALASFRLKGYAATTMDEIAAACDTAKHSIYRRFPSKEALFTAVVAADREAILTQIRSIEIKESDPLSTLREMCRSLLEVIVTPGNIDLYRMCIACEFNQTGERIVDVLEPLVVQAQKCKLLAVADPREFAKQLEFFVIGRALHAVLIDPHLQPTREVLDEHFNATWRIIMFGALPR
jgi:AcrR family transcriptional regulator